MVMVNNYAIIENNKVINIAVAEAPLADNWIQSDTAAIGDSCVDGVFTRPVPEVVIPQSCTPLQGLLAMEQAGLIAEYQGWAGSPERTFAEQIFIHRARTWHRDNPVLVAGATALGLDSEALDNLFILANTIEE